MSGTEPNPDAVFDTDGLVRELDRLLIRAAHGSGHPKLSLALLAHRMGIPRTQKSTLHNYLTGRTFVPVDKLDQIVVALGAFPDEQRRWSEAWYRVYDSRRLRSGAQLVTTLDRAESIEPRHLRETCRAMLLSAMSHDRFLVQIPTLRVPCSVYSADGGKRDGEDASDEVKGFIDNQAGNLLVVLGEFGAGKSRLLRRMAEAALDRDDVLPILLDYSELASRLAVEPVFEAIRRRIESISPPAAAEFLELAARRPEQLMILIDAFDEVNHSADLDHLGADLRRLSPLLQGRVKVAVAARRSITANPDEFVRQLQNPSRARGYGAASYTIMELGPCRIDEVHRALQPLSEQRASVVQRYLTTGRKLQMDRIRRPLFLRMLLELSGDLFGTTEPFSVYQLYEDFVATTVKRDFEEGRSAIPPDTKRRILQRVARDMFDAQSLRAEARLSSDDLHARVAEEIKRLSAGGMAFSVKAPKSHNWTEDFVKSNHLLVERSGSVANVTRDISFIHQSVFEFFLTQHFISEFSERGAFGLSDERHSVRAFDSLLPYFLRSRFGAGFREEEMVRLARDPKTSHLDRLLSLFFLEDNPSIVEILRQFPQYRSFLVEAEWTFDSFFMQKVVRFQLCLLDRGIGRALAYVTDLRTREVDADQDIEMHTFAARLSPTEFLLARLASDVLANVHPIVVYRLGLFGDRRALQPLNRYLGTSVDPLFQSLITEAAARIESRVAQEGSDTG